MDWMNKFLGLSCHVCCLLCGDVEIAVFVPKFGVDYGKTLVILILLCCSCLLSRSVLIVRFSLVALSCVMFLSRSCLGVFS